MSKPKLEDLVMNMSRAIDRQRELESSLANHQRMLGEQQIAVKQCREDLFNAFPELAQTSQAPASQSTVIDMDDPDGPPPEPGAAPDPRSVVFRERV